MAPSPGKCKYNNRKVTMDGFTFDSLREGQRYRDLKTMEKAGVISGLTLQPKFQLLPSQRVDGKCVERPLNYVADFSYYRDGRYIVEDAKGVRTKEYIIKRKLMLYVHGIRITEV